LTVRPDARAQLTIIATLAPPGRAKPAALYAAWTNAAHHGDPAGVFVIRSQ
jgi:hypothetical protein